MIDARLFYFCYFPFHPKISFAYIIIPPVLPSSPGCSTAEISACIANTFSTFKFSRFAASSNSVMYCGIKKCAVRLRLNKITAVKNFVFRRVNHHHSLACFGSDGVKFEPIRAAAENGFRFDDTEFRFRPFFASASGIVL